MVDNNNNNKKKTGSNFVFDIKEQQPTNAFQEEIGNESTCLLVWVYQLLFLTMRIHPL